MESNDSQQDLRESEERYRIIAENAAAGVFLIDEASTILFVNRAAETVFGYSVDELLGRKLTMLMPEHLRDRHLASIQRFVATGCRNISWEAIELAGRHKDGREIALEVSFGSFVAKDGKHRFVGLARDIGERKRARPAD